MTKTKKTKIIACVILLLMAVITILLIVLSIKTTYHGIDFNKPSRIIVYYDNETTNAVFEQDDERYNKIYNSILDGCKQPILPALLSNKLFKDVKIVENKTTEIDFSGITISFVYDLPQAVSYKNKVYTNNGETYWYSALIFRVPNNSKYQYNQIAIIPPENSSYYIGQYNYTLRYEIYSNFNSTFKLVNSILKNQAN